MSNLFGLSQPLQDQKATVSSPETFTTQTISKAILTGIKVASKKPLYTPNIKYLVFLYLILTIVFTTFFSKPVFADNLFSPSFEIKMGTINITGGKKTSLTYRLTDTVGQTAQGEFNSGGYTIKAGFQYIYDTTPFTFTISNVSLDFGSLVPGTPSTLSNILTVTTGSAFGYTVKAIEDHPLRLTGSLETIADTSCDLASPCVITDATPWTDNGRYGFGYNSQGTDTVADFVDSTYYRPFSIQGTDDPVTLMSRSGVATNSASTVTYKVHVSGSQAAGTYQNAIQYIATPAF